jgi:hypothetical protein
VRASLARYAERKKKLENEKNEMEKNVEHPVLSTDGARG